MKTISILLFCICASLICFGGSTPEVESYGRKCVVLWADPDVVDDGESVTLTARLSDGKTGVTVYFSLEQGSGSPADSSYVTESGGYAYTTAIPSGARVVRYKASAQGYGSAFVDVLFGPPVPPVPPPPTITSIDLSLHRKISANAYGFSFQLKITVNGTGLDGVEIRQRIKSSSTEKNWDGTDRTFDQIMAEKTAGSANAVDTKGKFEVDWNWSALRDLNDTKTQGAQYDNQVSNIFKEWVPIGGKYYRKIRRAEKFRSFVVEVHNKATGDILKTAEWGFTWNNDNAAWTATSSPPPPKDSPSCARGDLGSGEFKNVTNLPGLKEWK